MIIPSFQFHVINAYTTYIKHKYIFNVLLHVKCSFTNEKVVTFLAFIACNSMKFASNKQRQGHNNPTTIWRANLKEALEHSKSL